MKEFTYTIKDQFGLHARPAGQLAKMTKAYASSITLLHNGASCDVKQLLPLMAMGVKQNESVTIQAEGTDEDACIQEIAKFLEENV